MENIENIIKNIEKIDMTKGQYDELIDNIKRIKLQLQEIEDILNGRIKSSNIIEYRDNYVFNESWFLDASYPFIMDFELITDMTKLVQCKVSFKIRNFSSGVKL